MSFIAQAKQSRVSHLAPEVDLDMTPIMNLFVILVPSLVSIAVFVHIAIISVTLPPAAGAGTGGPKKSDLKLTVSVGESGFTVSLGDALLDSLPKAAGKFDLAALTNSLTRIRDRLADKDDLVVAVDDGIIFDEVVAAMDAGRQGGFSRVSLAGGVPKKKDKP
jgi:biopolymer transport protein ExbD